MVGLLHCNAEGFFFFFFIISFQAMHIALSFIIFSFLLSHCPTYVQLCISEYYVQYIDIVVDPGQAMNSNLL